MKEIEIPFGAKDSELKGREYTIPEGMEAEIKDGKIVVRKKESEDERIRKWIINLIKEVEYDEDWCVKSVDCNKAVAYLEKQKEQSLRDFIDDFPYNDQKKQKPVDRFGEAREKYQVEWSEEDEKNCNRIIRFLEPHKTFFPTKETKEEMQNWLKNRLKSLHPQYHGNVTMTEAYKMGLEAGKASSWKPSEQEKGALRTAIHILTDERSFPKAAAQLQNILDTFEGKESRKDWKPSEEQIYSLGTVVKGYDECTVGSVGYNLKELYEQLKKLM